MLPVYTFIRLLREGNTFSIFFFSVFNIISLRFFGGVSRQLTRKKKKRRLEERVQRDSGILKCLRAKRIDFEL